MRWLLRCAVALAALMALVASVGWMLPIAHEASRSAVFPQPPERLYPAVAELVRAEQQRTGVRVEVTESSPPRRMVTRIADADQPFGGTWTYELALEGTGTRLTLIERGEIYNPVFRFMARFVFGYTATMDEFLEKLKQNSAR